MTVAKKCSLVENMDKRLKIFLMLFYATFVERISTGLAKRSLFIKPLKAEDA